MILVIDNHDSFTYNLVQYLGELGASVEVVRNDGPSVADVEALRPEGIVISPGPGRAERAGVTLELVRRTRGRIPLLGVCLGHQAIAEAFGARVVPAARLMHGRTSSIEHDGRGLFRGLPQHYQAMRYHSWVVEADTIPPELELCAWTDAAEVMGLRHRALPIAGVQFHPESFMSEHGHALLSNFLDTLPRRGAAPAQERTG
jgi:anthranilate synthase/aminodeoxychorismate synthase-like glutamine amidotransferase